MAVEDCKPGYQDIEYGNVDGRIGCPGVQDDRDDRGG